jgi:hypothetical protein
VWPPPQPSWQEAPRGLLVTGRREEVQYNSLGSQQGVQMPQAGCRVPSHRAARGRWQDINKPSRGGGRGQGGETGPRSNPPALVPRGPSPTADQVLEPMPRGSEYPPEAQHPLSQKPTHKAVGPVPCGALPERAIWVAGVSAGRAQHAPLAEKLLKQRRSHAGHGNPGSLG